MKIIRDILSSGTDYLSARGVDAPRFSMQSLLTHVLGCDRTWLYLHYEDPVDEEKLSVLRELLRRGIPVVVNSDAHAPSLLSRDYERAVRVLRDVAPRGLRECRCATPVSGAELHAFVSC